MTMIERRWFAMINFMDLRKGQEYTITELLALKCFEDIRRKTLYSSAVQNGLHPSAAH